MKEIDEEITVANVLTQNTTYCRKCFANTLTVVYDPPSIVSIMLLIIDLPIYLLTKDGQVISEMWPTVLVPSEQSMVVSSNRCAVNL